ncbi:Uncharacterized protein QTN25_004394 [Entamoeba marina]
MRCASDDIDLLQSDQIMRKTAKLSKLTGRQDSVSHIAPFLVSTSTQDATKNAQLIHKSDKIKKVSGTRPLSFEVDSENGENVRRIAVLQKRFGETSDIADILPYVLTKPQDTDEAVDQGKKLKQMEKVKKRLGSTSDS